ncbi:MAG TPA: glycosyltransferase family 39 protein, partial [Flavobacterium alvei]|nr:glycosyltransferase family 39 protein [Flavobacterium alvei]
SVVNKQKNYSGEFYSNGKEQVLINQKEVDSVLSLNKKLFFVIPTRKLEQVSKESLEKMNLIDHNNNTSVFESK